MKKHISIIAMLLVLLMALTGCTDAVQRGNTAAGYSGIDVASPEWVGTLEAASDAQQIFVVAAFDQNATDAWISLHEKQADGTWRMVMTTPGFIGKNGLGKTKSGDAKTPVGKYHFNRAFGIADDPGSLIPYVKVDDETYWSGDDREGFHYNELVQLSDVPGLGSAIFLHCFGPAKPFSGGCVAIPEDYMKFVMQRVDENTVVLIDTYENLSGTDEWPDSRWPQER